MASAAGHILQVKDLVAGYIRDLPILHGVSVYVDRGEIVTIIGPNGAGKSTLIKAVAGLVSVSQGSIELNGKNIVNVPAYQRATQGVGYVPQTGNVFTTLSIHENLIMGGASLHRGKAERRIEELYEIYPVLKSRRREKAGVLSGGQRQILAVARALLTQPDLILLDEPTAGLSPKAAAELFALIRDLSRDGVAVLIVEQNAKAALRNSDRGYVLAEGENRIDGAAHTLLADKEIGEIFLGMRRDTPLEKEET